MNVLVTGGAGFIGSHTCVALLAAGYKPVIVDDFSNSDKTTVEKLNELTETSITFEELNILDQSKLGGIMKQHDIEAVIHFAAFKAVNESIEKPLVYFNNNLGGLLSVLAAMEDSGISNLVFSSSATVYGEPDVVPISEESPLKPPTNPYGQTKQMGEQIIESAYASPASSLKAVSLRYFNPIGAHPSGKIGELPKGVPSNLVPFVTQAAAGIRDKLTIFGDDYDTPDGSAVRDYIHVMDLAEAHVAALDYLSKQNDKMHEKINIGTGKGTTVLELIQTFESVNNVTVPHMIGPRRDGDVESCYASADKAAQLLNWRASRDLEESLKDAWRWQQSISV